MTYERRVDRQHPGCLIFLVDQSESMSQQLRGTPTPKSAALADQLNSLIYELIQRCTKSLTEPPRPYFALSVIGYCTDDNGDPVVGSVLPGTTGQQDLAWTTDLASAPRRMEQRVRPVEEGGQRYVFPVWVEPLATGGTPVCEAINRAGRLARRWLERFPDAFPPIVINFSDGESTDGDPRIWATRLRSLHSTDGSVLFFNLDLTSTKSSPVLFADQPDKGWSPFTCLMFEMSSELPDMMLAAARAHGFPVTDRARGFGSNADFRSVVSFLNVGTSIGRLMR